MAAGMLEEPTEYELLEIAYRTANEQYRSLLNKKAERGRLNRFNFSDKRDEVREPRIHGYIGPLPSDYFGLKLDTTYRPWSDRK